MILGAAPDDAKQVMRGQYTPEQFGKLTLWQLRNIFGYKAESKPFDMKEAFWKRLRILGTDEFEIWRRWHDDMSKVVENKP